jgi:hypothetical protein
MAEQHNTFVYTFQDAIYSMDERSDRHIPYRLAVALVFSNTERLVPTSVPPQPRWSDMLIPRYWSRAESQAVRPDGKPVRFHVWRGSRGSAAEAQSLANEAVSRIADRISRGAGFPERYAYGDRPLREEVVREIPGPGDAPNVAITRNSYGALVLNAASAFFIDVDVAGLEGAGPHASPSSGPSTPSAPCSGPPTATPWARRRTPSASGSPTRCARAASG